jgi:ferredoxin
MRIQEENCTHCGTCAAACKMDTRRALDRECIRCGECAGICPARALRRGREGGFLLRAVKGQSDGAVPKP